MDGSTQDVKLGDGPSTVKIQRTNEWSLREILLNVPSEAKYVRIEPFFETGTGTTWFDMLKLVQLPESPKNNAAYNAIRSHWYQKLMGGSGMNNADPDVSAYIQQLTEQVSNSQGTGYLDTIHTDIQANSLWDGLINQKNTNSAAISAAYGRLREMSLVYEMEMSTLHKDSRLRDQ